VNWKSWGRIRLSQAQLAVIIVVFLVLFSIYNAVQYSPKQTQAAPAPQSRWHGLPDYIQDPDAGARTVEQLCRKANGDISKLSEDELKYLNAISAGNGENMVRMKAQQYAQERKQAQQHAKEKPTSTPHPSEQGKEAPHPGTQPGRTSAASP
jgi:hypothetical protein